MDDDFMLKPLPKKKPTAVRETKVEQARKQYVAAQGGMSWKFVSPGMPGVPDQIELYGVVPMACALDLILQSVGVEMTQSKLEQMSVSLLRHAIQFTEAKQHKKVPAEVQQRRHRELRDLGFHVNVIDKVQP